MYDDAQIIEKTIDAMHVARLDSGTFLRQNIFHLNNDGLDKLVWKKFNMDKSEYQLCDKLTTNILEQGFRKEEFKTELDIFTLTYIKFNEEVYRRSYHHLTGDVEYDKGVNLAFKYVFVPVRDSELIIQLEVAYHYHL
jgi:hypothetical protein